MPRPADTYTHDQSEDLLTNAVQHSFLAYVGSGSLSENDFNQWLAQIGYISRSLVPFTIALIGKIRIPETENLEHNSTFRCLDLLCSAITNMKKELGFLEATKREYGLEVGLDELRLATKSFIAPLQFLLTISSVSADAEPRVLRLGIFSSKPIMLPRSRQFDFTLAAAVNWATTSRATMLSS
ncbi:unnamed protein product [Fusarium graminearum]|uniref:Uncharacterized protein n=1 Tax=Gibberella zeae TaxID=5518 RepID=A0A4E9ELB1_GIBZA|nr:unnamed protein product [Fusarium graminearum]CAG2006981.1 unnamed protein product [Fusarium graminearum]